MESTPFLPASCQEHGCTADDCVCWEYEDVFDDAPLLAAAFGRSDIDPGAWTIEYITDARLLTVLGPGDRPVKRLYLDETTGQIDDIPLHIEYAVDAQDHLNSTTFGITGHPPYDAGI